MATDRGVASGVATVASALKVIAPLITYQLHIQLTRSVTIAVGQLGKFQFPAGQYIYTGSAKRNLEARIQRHLSKHKKLRWHIDYLLAHRNVQVVQVQRSAKGECAWNHKTNGKIIVAGFGSSDCRAGCGSHLKYVGKRPANSKLVTVCMASS